MPRVTTAGRAPIEGTRESQALLGERARPFGQEPPQLEDWSAAAHCGSRCRELASWRENPQNVVSESMRCGGAVQTRAARSRPVEAHANGFAFSPKALPGPLGVIPEQ
jgi:hypothetical protein